MTEQRIGIEASACLTALGNAAESCRRLAAGEIALKPLPVLADRGGGDVPLAIVGDYAETIPPRWLPQIDALAAEIPPAPWGDARHPVFVTSSNYDVGSLYQFRVDGDERHLRLGSPGPTLAFLRERFRWGENARAISHACVSANVGLELASRHLRAGVADRALLFSFDFVSPFVAGGFHALKILNSRFPAPYEDREAGAIGLGDGAAFVVLGREPAEFSIKSHFLYNEMYHATANDPTGSGFDAAARWLGEAADGAPFWIKGHGTGTLDAGRLEAESLAQAFPDSPLVSWKGSLGHTLGSCGAVELAIAIEAFRQGVVPGTPGLSGQPFANNVARARFACAGRRSAALFSNAFGGAHAACLLAHER